ncbi:MAG: hypothetical protein ACD_61C00053G0011 [uncultured bacterium]|nr:MAG: hypothetical protein ACD_61C00053G0011 [uncultured bacterium]
MYDGFMSLTQNDLNKLGTLVGDKLSVKLNLLEEKLLGEMDKRDEKLVGKMGKMVDKNNDKMLLQFSELMDKRLLKFHEEVTEPMVNNIYDRLHEEVSLVADNTYRIEKKLDHVADHHSEKIDDHEKRIVRLEGRAVPSL